MRAIRESSRFAKPAQINKIHRTPAGTEGAGDEGQLAIDMSSTQPHTMTKEARTCESCQLSDKALGYGLGGGKMTRPPNQPLFVDLEPADQQVLPRKTRPQAEPMDGLADDWSRVVSEDGRQLQTVGHHFRLSRPLNDRERANMDRRGVCLGCHQEIPDRSLAASLLHHVAQYSGQIPKNADEHTSLTHKILLTSAWGQMAALTCLPLILVAGAFLYARQRRSRRNRRST